MGYLDRPDRQPLAVVATVDGRRVHVQIEAQQANPLSLLRSILVAIESLIGLIVGDDRRENGGSRRSER